MRSDDRCIGGIIIEIVSNREATFSPGRIAANKSFRSQLSITSSKR
jgi:hypothetical protein